MIASYNKPVEANPMGTLKSSKTSGQLPVSILIEIFAPSSDANLYTIPADLEANKLSKLAQLLMDQRNLPIAPHLPAQIFALIRDTKSSPREHIYGFGGSCFLISQSLRDVIEKFPPVCAEWIPVTAYSAKAWDGFRLTGFDRKIDEPYWLLHVRNSYDIIDQRRSRGHWVNTEENLPADYLSKDRLTPQFVGEEIVLKDVPSDPLFQIDGLYGMAGKTFVSEEFFGAIMDSDLVHGTYDPARGYPSSFFRPFRLNKNDKRTAGYRVGQNINSTVPFIINGRSVFFGNLNLKIDFDIEQRGDC